MKKIHNIDIGYIKRRAGLLAAGVATLFVLGGTLPAQAYDYGYYDYYDYYDAGYDGVYDNDWYYDYYDYNSDYSYDYDVDWFDWEEDGLFN
jgi:hypothetical protein